MVAGQVSGTSYAPPDRPLSCHRFLLEYVLLKGLYIALEET